MSFLHHCFRTFLILTLSAIAVPAAAQTTLAAAKSGEAKDGAEQRAPLRSHELSLGDIRAVVQVQDNTLPLAAGSSTFASITLASSSRSAADFEIALRAENATIKSLFDDGDISADGREASIGVKGLRSGRNRRILAELALPAEASLEPALHVSLRPARRDEANADPVSTRVSWKLADCAARFQTAISEAASSKLSVVEETLSALRPARKRGSSDWIFQPNLRRHSQASGCRRKVREYDETLRRWVRRCPDDGQAKPHQISKEERALILEAQGVMRTGGADPNLTRDSSVGWATFKAASDLKNYLRQPPNPAICTGAVEFSQYYIENLEKLKSRAARILALSRSAPDMIGARLDRLRTLSAELGGGHPAWGGATLALARPPADTNDLRSAVLEVARLSGLPDAAVREAESAPSLRDALAVLKGEWKARTVTDQVFTAQAELALSLIEAASMVAELASKYEALDRNFLGGFRFIQEAYGTHCNCAAN